MEIIRKHSVLLKEVIALPEKLESEIRLELTKLEQKDQDISEALLKLLPSDDNMQAFKKRLFEVEVHIMSSHAHIGYTDHHLSMLVGGFLWRH